MNNREIACYCKLFFDKFKWNWKHSLFLSLFLKTKQQQSFVEGSAKIYVCKVQGYRKKDQVGYQPGFLSNWIINIEFQHCRMSVPTQYNPVIPNRGAAHTRVPWEGARGAAKCWIYCPFLMFYCFVCLR